jgi:uncharacterized protein (TIGR02594 family)
MSNLLEIALSLYGLKEIPGTENNPQIMIFFHSIGQDWVQGDETAWCSAFINWCAKTEGLTYSGKLNARSWLNFGTEVSIEEADIAVLWRSSPDSWKGHVGIPIREDGDSLWLLGGNQSNMVKISAYPKERVLKYIKL